MGLTKADKVYLLNHTMLIVHKVSCDLCGREDLTKYVYGALRISHTWAELCIHCHVKHGIGVDGRGKGTIYSWNNRTNVYEISMALTSSYMQFLDAIKEEVMSNEGVY